MGVHKKFGLILLGCTLTLSETHGDDIEIYTNASNGAGGKPLVMFSVDYRSNLGSTVCNGTECNSLVAEGYLASTPTTRFALLRAVLQKVLSQVGGVKIGLMINHANNNNCVGPAATGCSNGGYILSGFRDIVTDATAATDPTLYATEVANKAAFHTKLSAIPLPSGSVSHTYQGKELFFEFFRYLTGQGIYNGHAGYKDYGNNSAAANLDVDFPNISWDTSIESSGNYTSPLLENCSKIFTINFMFQVSNQESDSDGAITATKASGGLSGINLSGSNNKFSTVLDWLHRTDLGDGTWGTANNLHGDQSVTSYFIVDPSQVNNTTNGYASAGGTTSAYGWSDNPETLVTTISSIFRQILSVSTTFTAASIPVSVLNRAQVVNNVYLALFEADAAAKPRWPGNLKKLSIDSTNGLLLDANGANAVAVDGRIREDALTYWTDTATLNNTNLDASEVAGRDGRSVARGGAGQKIPGYASGSPGLSNGASGRTLYYEPATLVSGAAPPAFNADSSTATALESLLTANSSSEAETLLKFARGYDVNDEDLDGSTTDVRPWILGDPLHSRPIPINYGALNGHTASNPDIRIVMGTNSGFLHMFRNTASDGSQTGAEVWGFMPRAVMPIIKELKANVPTNPAHLSYGVDGAPAAYVKDVNNDGVISAADGDIVWLYFGLRLGGKNYYALNISDPDAPKILWGISATGDFAELGYTFSSPRIGTLDWGSGNRPVVMFAGGYDLNKDSDDDDDTMGNAIYVVDAQTGALVWKATTGASIGSVSATHYTHTAMKDSIPSDLTTLDTNGDGLVDRMYVGDTGGTVWRIDTSGNDRTQWKATRLASLGRHFDGTSAHDRRFFHRPDFVKHRDASGSYDAVILGSGNRAHPLQTYANDFMYMIKDRNITAGGGDDGERVDHDDLADLSDNCLQDNSCASAPVLTNGWKIEMEEAGEKVLATATTIAGSIYFTSYTPSDSNDSTSCEPSEGTGRLYAVDLDNAIAVKDYALSNNAEDGTAVVAKIDRYVRLNAGGIPAEVVFIPDNQILRPDLTIEELAVDGRWKTFWYPVEN